MLVEVITDAAFALVFIRAAWEDVLVYREVYWEEED